MPTQVQLERESWWLAETEAPAHAALNARLRAFYDHTRAQTGSKGDTNHLRGRHRSRNWALNSAYCTDRSYGSRDARDKRGDGDWLRATDVGIQGDQLHAAARRLDAAVLAGHLPCVAEWFGSIDGRNVIGWYEGHPSSSDASHLWHLHFGLWTGSCNDAAQLQLLGNVITGEDTDMGLTDQEHYVQHVMNYRVAALAAGSPTYAVPAITIGGQKFPAMTGTNATVALLNAIAAKVDIDPAELDAIRNAAREGAVSAAADLAAAVIDHLPAGPMLSRADVEQAVRDAFAGGLAPDAD